MKLIRITFTGVDAPLQQLSYLAHLYPFVEWGILVSKSRSGVDPRYPSDKRIYEIFDRIDSDMVKFAIHLCGSYSRDALRGGFTWAIKYNRIFYGAKRIQFNSRVAHADSDSINRVEDYAEEFPRHKFILQCPEFPMVLDAATNVDYLLDNSGGNGVDIGDLPAPTPSIRCGYSGGIGPHNLEGILEKLCAMGSDKDEFWVDMETNVRTDNFSISTRSQDAWRSQTSLPIPVSSGEKTMMDDAMSIVAKLSVISCMTLGVISVSLASLHFIDKLLVYVKACNMFIEYIVHRREFIKYIKNKRE